MSYYQADGLGSVTSLSDSKGNLISTYEYDSFGNLLASTGSISNSFRFTGREFDAETDLYFYRARYYDPSIGRFISEDPIRFDAGTNFYTYVQNNPVNLVDPYGLQSGAPTAPGMPWFPPILPPVFYPGTPENDAFVEDVNKITDSIGELIKDSFNEYGCDGEWAEAYRMCQEELDSPCPNKGITGGYTNVHNCARGLVSQRCGGNAVN